MLEIIFDPAGAGWDVSRRKRKLRSEDCNFIWKLWVSVKFWCTLQSALAMQLVRLKDETRVFSDIEILVVDGGILITKSWLKKQLPVPEYTIILYIYFTYVIVNNNESISNG